MVGRPDPHRQRTHPHHQCNKITGADDALPSSLLANQQGHVIIPFLSFGTGAQDSSSSERGDQTSAWTSSRNNKTTTASNVLGCALWVEMLVRAQHGNVAQVRQNDRKKRSREGVVIIQLLASRSIA